MPDQPDPELLQRLCEMASKETNTEKLLDLTRQINEFFEKKNAASSSEARSKKPA